MPDTEQLIESFPRTLDEICEFHERHPEFKDKLKLHRILGDHCIDCRRPKAELDAERSEELREYRQAVEEDIRAGLIV